MSIATPSFSRSWAMPSKDTFSIAPIRAILDRWIKPGDVVVDPFARNSKIGTYRNDLNPNTEAEYHMDAALFAAMLHIDYRVQADVVLFDPPYSPRQISECYQSFGQKVTADDTQNAALYCSVKAWLHPILKCGGIAISFGWNSSGFPKHLYERLETHLICHGGAHNDTIVCVDRKLEALF